MDIFKNRLPARDAVLNALAVCMLPVFIWSIIGVLKEVPAWVLRLSLWDLIGVVSYTQAFALIESMLLFLPLLILAILLPERFFRRSFLAQVTTFVVISSIWFILAHSYDAVIRTWGVRQFLPWVLIVGCSFIFTYFFVQRVEWLRKMIDAVAKRVSVLSFFYMSFGIIGVLIVIVRNAMEAS